ncbi:MAG: succinyl-diaminopimelate desuccinylase [Rhodospirillaceae bacterium]|nr:succinyl-diaminopimelate desuccinylase [Rhodospirillaceae bacterium]
MIDPIELSQALIKCPSVTPVDAGALAVLEGALAPMGFNCNILSFSAPGTPDVKNLYARLGKSGQNLCFAGHTDVVPVGDENAWTYPPFDAEIKNGVLYGRGVVDMKCAIAAFVSATSRFISENGADFGGSISFLITGDEEGPAINGTKKVLSWMADNGETMDGCIVGEPTNPERLGQMIKIGRRGSLNGYLRVVGTQGHVAYPQNAENPMPRLLKMLSAISENKLDEGTEYFQPSNLEITSVDVGNPTTNIIPGEASARFNIRFNDTHNADSLKKWLREKFEAINGEDGGGKYSLDIEVSGEAFITPPGVLSTVMGSAVKKITGHTPEMSTSGGTSDARFIKDHCPVAEFGLMNATAHKVDENSAIEDIQKLTEIYFEMISGFFKSVKK